ncbi:hypothetical protein PENTCL1PPCAC_15466, partial [Pristionchus entomophagus]
MLSGHILLPLASAAYSADPRPCMHNVIPGATLNRRFEIPCDSSDTNTCSAYTWVDVTRRMIGLVFRGTNEEAQFEVELPAILAARPKDFQNGGKVVPYFDDAFFSLWNNADLGNNVKEMSRQYPDFDLYLTGHSLGGAMAAVSAYHIVTNKVHPLNRVFLYTFGEPRNGDAHLARLLDSSIRAFRIVHNRDLAPHIPFRSMGYQHHGVEVWF